MQRILVVEDDPDIREVLVYALSELAPYTVEACGRGDEAVDATLAFRPDLVLLDAMLPGLDGPGVIGALRARPETHEIPVVFLTARTRPTDVAELLHAGALRVLAKPIDLDGLRREVEQAWAESTTPTQPLDPPAASKTRFLERLGERLRRLAALRDERSDEARQEMRQLAHSLAGSSGTYGFPRLGEAARALERLLMEVSDPCAVAAAVQKLLTEATEAEGYPENATRAER